MIRRTWVFASMVGAALGLGRAGHVCDLAFSECPGKFSSGTIKVPKEMIWLDAKIPFCDEFVQITDAKPPAIVFIIDNSGSMDENDPEVARFKVVSTLLDNLYSLAPASEVGLVVFTRRLSFDHRENPFFQTAFPEDTAQHDSFVPLTALNRKFPDGKTGLDTLKALLKHDDRGNLNYVTRLPASRNNAGMGRANTRDGTDISLGFQAARQAMKRSSDRASQYFIFLSDGTPSTPDNGREGLSNEFIAGTATPATFTVFFDTQNNPPVVPPTILQMTGNIRANGYSGNNPKSDFWAINLPEAQLQTLLQTQVLGKVLSVPAKPKAASLAMGDATYRNLALDARNFVFSRRFALKGDTTRLQLEFIYAYVDTSGGKPVPKEKVVPYALSVIRSQAVPLPAGTTQSCKEQAELSLHRNGQPISAVTADDSLLEARLFMPDGSPCKDCHVEAMPSSAGSKDRETLLLAPGAGYLTGSFRREVGLVPAIGDGRLQHLPGDSIVLLYVSPENPLDRVRKAFRYTDVPARLELGGQNSLLRSRFSPAFHLPVSEPQWLIRAPATVQPRPLDPYDHWRLAPDAMSPQDSLRHAGITVEASRAFQVEIRIFSTLGEFVNKLSLAIDQAEFMKLEKSSGGNSRLLRIYWDSRARTGVPVGTGAYVIKTSAILLALPGLAEDPAVRSEFRRVGVLRSP